MSKRHKPYSKDSRTTIWRRNLPGDASGCSCLYHSFANNWDRDSRCFCEYHEAAQNESNDECVCPYHEAATTEADMAQFDSKQNSDPYISEDDECASSPDTTEEDEGEDPHNTDTGFDFVGANEVTFQMNCSNDTTCSKGNVIQECQVAHFRNEDSVYSDGDYNTDSTESSFHEQDSSASEQSFPGYDSSSSDEDSSSNDGDGSDDSLGDPNGDDPNGDDPNGDDPNGDGGPEINENNEAENLDEGNFSLRHPSLNRILQAAEGRTAREMLAMVLALAVRHNLNYVTLIGICRILNTCSAFQTLPSTVKQLWSVLQRRHAGIVKNAYCPRCYTDLGLVTNLQRNVVCLNQNCNYQCRRRLVKYYITLSIKRQIKSLLETPNIWRHLQYKNERQKLNENAYEDVLDGDGYRALEEIENGLRNPINFSFQINTDGFSSSRSSNSQVYPILIRINELPPNLRQRFTLLGGVIISDGDPDLNMFFQKLVDELNDLATNGIEWSPEEGNIIRSRFFVTCLCLDARARAALLNLNLYSGHFSCAFCLHPAVKIGAMKFPLPCTPIVRMRRNIEQVYVVPEAPLRTHEGIQEDMIQATLTGRTVNGFKGPSVLLNLEGIDLSYCCSPDDLHPIYIGCTKYLTNLILDGDGNGNLIALIDARLCRIRTPTHISRKPRSIKKRGKYKGSEWKSWLLYLGVPCMSGLIGDDQLQLFSLLSKGVFLLSQDSITDENINEAERCLQRFLIDFQNLYGAARMRFNLHMMNHVARAVRIWGPLHLHSTVPYESWNGRLKKHISSPYGAVDQIVNRFLLESLAYRLIYEEGIDDEVREELTNILSRFTMENPVVIGSTHFFGRHTVRIPTDDEAATLNAAGIRLDQNVELIEYYQCRKSRMLLHSTRYYEHYADDRDSKSSNKVIFTTDNQFCCIDSIVVFEQGGNQVGGMFCHLWTVEDPEFDGFHIRPVVNDDNRLFIQTDRVRKLAIEIGIDNETFVTPMANMGELD